MKLCESKICDQIAYYMRMTFLIRCNMYCDEHRRTQKMLLRLSGIEMAAAV